MRQIGFFNLIKRPNITMDKWSSDKTMYFQNHDSDQFNIVITNGQDNSVKGSGVVEKNLNKFIDPGNAIYLKEAKLERLMFMLSNIGSEDTRLEIPIKNTTLVIHGGFFELYHNGVLCNHVFIQEQRGSALNMECCLNFGKVFNMSIENNGVAIANSGSRTETEEIKDEIISNIFDVYLSKEPVPIKCTGTDINLGMIVYQKCWW